MKLNLNLFSTAHRRFVLVTCFVDVFNYFSYSNLKYFICSPISKQDIHHLLNYNINDNNMFNNLHYLQSLTFLYDNDAIHIQSDQINLLTSGTTINEIRRQMELIKKSLSDKVKRVDDYDEKMSSIAQLVNFDMQEVFQKFTAFKIIEMSCDLITKIILTFNKIEICIRPENKNITFQQYLIYFFELLVRVLYNHRYYLRMKSKDYSRIGITQSLFPIIRRREEI